MAKDSVGRMRGAAPIIVFSVLLAGCASHPYVSSHSADGPAGDGQGAYRVGAPYEIKGIWYYPAIDYNYDKTGVASWYGEYFQGRQTANGEIFDLNQLTAANTTLPMPSVVQVTNLQNGRSLRLRVNDRGPFVDGRLIDVSRRAAQLLGFETQGTTPVRVTIIKDASIEVAEEAMRNGGGSRVLVAEAPSAAPLAAAVSRRSPAAPNRRPSALAATAIAAPIADTQPQPPLPPRLASTVGPIADAQMPPSRPKVTFPSVEPPGIAPVAIASVEGSGHIFVQAGAFSVRNNAQRVRSRIAPLGRVKVMTASIHGVEVYRVRLGPLANVEQAGHLLSRVVVSGYPQARIVTD